jgi:hypothetical protein
MSCGNSDMSHSLLQTDLDLHFFADSDPGENRNADPDPVKNLNADPNTDQDPDHKKKC